MAKADLMTIKLKMDMVWTFPLTRYNRPEKISFGLVE